jgi:hypothetical protein
LRDVGEYGQQGWTVTLLDNAGQPLNLRKQIEPNNFADGPVGTAAINGAVLGALGSSTDGRVGVIADPDRASNKVFAGYSTSTQSFVSTWTASRQFQATLVAETTTVSIDAIGILANSYGRLEAYNSQGQLVGRYTTKALSPGQTETMTISRGTSDISYVIASGTARTSVKLDNLRHGAEASAQTTAQGHYYFPAIPAGTYEVQVTGQPGWAALNPANGKLQATVTNNTATTDIDFGFVQSGSAWQNPTNPLDVDNNQRVTPIDALLVINQLNKARGGVLAGSSIPTFPYIDVNGDGRLSPTDALIVISALNRGRGQGEGSGEGASASIGVCFPSDGGVAPMVGEGERGEKERRAADDELLLLLSLDRLMNSSQVN